MKNDASVVKNTLNSDMTSDVVHSQNSDMTNSAPVAVSEDSAKVGESETGLPWEQISYVDTKKTYPIKPMR